MELRAQAIDKGIFPGTQGGPLMHMIAAKAVCFEEAMQPSFRVYQERVLANAKALAKSLSDCGIRLVSGGTDNHLLLIDLGVDGPTGKETEILLDKVHITANKNSVPNETRSPFVTSGIRLGSPAATTRGLTEEDFATVGKCIARMIQEGESAIEEGSEIVAGITKKYPLYPESMK